MYRGFWLRSIEKSLKAEEILLREFHPDGWGFDLSAA